VIFPRIQSFGRASASLLQGELEELRFNKSQNLHGQVTLLVHLRLSSRRRPFSLTPSPVVCVQAKGARSGTRPEDR
jgi:hypothetical protein